MYYPRLESIGEKLGLPSTTTARVDQWLSMLPRYRLRALLPSDATKEAGLSPCVAFQLFYAATPVGFLRPVYSVCCPECEELVDQFTDQAAFEDEYMCAHDHGFVPAEHPDHIMVACQVMDKPKKEDKSLVAL